MRRVRAIIGVFVCVAASLTAGELSAQAVTDTPSETSSRAAALVISQEYYNKAIAAKRYGDFDVAIEQYQLAWAAGQPYLEGTGKEAAILLEAIGMCYYQMLQFGQADVYLRKAYEEIKSQEPENSAQIANLLRVLGSASRRNGAHVQAIEWMQAELTQRRLMADRIQSTSTYTLQERERGWIGVARAVTILFAANPTDEALPQLEAALLALQPFDDAIETRLQIMTLAANISNVPSPAKALVFTENALTLSEKLPNSPDKQLRQAEFKYQQSQATQRLMRPLQALTQLQEALTLLQTVPRGVERDELIYNIAKDIATKSAEEGEWEEVVTWSLRSLNLAKVGSRIVSSLVGLGAAQIRLERYTDAKRSADEAFRVLQQFSYLRNNDMIINRMLLSQIYAELLDVERSLSLYEAARADGDSLKSRAFTEASIDYLVLGTKALLIANQEARAYADLAQAGQFLVNGPGCTFGVNADSRRIFDKYRYVFKNQMRVGWIAAHADGAPPAPGATNETR